MKVGARESGKILFDSEDEVQEKEKIVPKLQFKRYGKPFKVFEFDLLFVFTHHIVCPLSFDILHFYKLARQLQFS